MRTSVAAVLPQYAYKVESQNFLNTHRNIEIYRNRASFEDCFTDQGGPEQKFSSNRS